MSDDALFGRAVATLLAHEGGWSDVGPTNWGFDLRYNPDLTAAALRAMTRDGAAQRYRAKWWEPYRWRELPPDVAVKCFDLAVNMGPLAIVKCLQAALRACGKPVAQDGDLGTITVTAAADADAPALLAALRSEAAAFYRIDCAVHPERSGDLAGWVDRAYS